MLEPEYYRFHLNLAKKYRFDNALEIGYGAGESATAYLEGCAGHLTSIDMINKPEAIGIDRLTFVNGESPQIMGSKEVLANAPYDYVYIDGDKRKYHVYKDAESIVNLLQKGGLLVFDDCSNDWAVTVNEAIESFIKDFPLFEEIKLEFTNPHGSRAFIKI